MIAAYLSIGAVVAGLWVMLIVMEPEPFGLEPVDRWLIVLVGTAIAFALMVLWLPLVLLWLVRRP